MSVADPVIDRLELSTKSIYLKSGVRSYHPVDDIYKEVRQLRAIDESLRPFDIPIKAFGMIPKGGGKFTPRYAVFYNSWKIVPEDVSHSLFVSGEQLTDEGEAGPACLRLTGLSPGVSVIVHYEPPTSEVIQVVVGGDVGGSGDTKEAIYLYFTSNGRQNIFKVDVSDLAKDSTVMKAVNYVAPANADIQSIKNTIENLPTVEVDSESIYEFFTTEGRQNTFKSDISSLAKESTVMKTDDPKIEAMKTAIDVLPSASEISETILNRIIP